MSTEKQSEGLILPEYALDNLGVSFKVVLVDSVECSLRNDQREYFIPNYQGLLKTIAIARAAHPQKLKSGDIKFLRKTLGLRGRELAEKLDISPEHMSRCETGDKTLSLNSEKVLRSLVILEGVYVLQKAIEDCGTAPRKLQERLSSLLEKLQGVVSGIKISPVHSAGEELVLHLRCFAEQTDQRPANDGALLPEWGEAA